MSYQAFFEQTEAVVKVLDDFVRGFEPSSESPDFVEEAETGVELTQEEFSAIWQAVELLSRAYTALLPQIQAEVNKVALNLPDVVEKKAHLYDAQGRPLT